MTKKEQILSLYATGVTEVADLAAVTGAKPAYVAGILQEAGELPGYFDLYTSTNRPMNLHAKFFANRLGFRDEATARKSVQLIADLYRQFEAAGDRPGQHHALLMALTMYNRARWSRKPREAELFRQWLVKQLSQPEPIPEPAPAAAAPEPVAQG